jgi:hypothetical protein
MLCTYLANSIIKVLRLKTLILDSNLLTNKCANAICGLLQQPEVLYNTINQLSLKNNRIGDVGVREICKAIVYRYNSIWIPNGVREIPFALLNF